MALTIISDVHGKYSEYFNLCDKYENTLQIGDMGFSYQQFMHRLDESRHKFFGGNHDNYDIYNDSPHQIGQYGTYSHGGVPFFFVRGAFSIDFKFRILKELRGDAKSWWQDEELGFHDLKNCLEQYKHGQPNIMITHDGPRCATGYMTQPDSREWLSQYMINPDLVSNTVQLFDTMLEWHKPKLWIFGHWHKDLDIVVDGTRFICLRELGVIEDVHELL